MDDPFAAPSSNTSHDVVTYEIYLIRDEASAQLQEDVHELEALRSECLAAVTAEASGYIWQHERFDLRVNSAAAPDKGVVPHLEGRVRYGDNVEDEWLVVSLILKLTRRFHKLVARVRDGDGEFLLIEAAAALPKWVTPTYGENRVYLHRGEVHLLPRSTGGTGKIAPSVQVAAKALLSDTVNTVVPPPVRKALEPRLKGMPKRTLKEGMHQARCRLPRSVAYLLQQEPQLLSPAVNTFYNRLPQDLKAATKMSNFPPNDFVTVLVSFNKCLFAQLMQQRFEPPKTFPMPPHQHPDYPAAQRGMKVACAFEMMYAASRKHAARSSQGASQGVGEGSEATSPAAGAAEPLAGDASWAAFKMNLLRNSYFAGELEGSRRYRELMQQAVIKYQSSEAYTVSTAKLEAPAQRCTELLEGVDLDQQTFQEVSRDEGEDERWLERGEALLERELQQRQEELTQLANESEDEEDQSEDGSQSEGEGDALSSAQQTGARTNGDKQKDDVAQQAEKLQNVVKGIHDLMNSKSSYKGVELGEQLKGRIPGGEEGDSDSDSEMGFDTDMFMSELQSVLGLRSESRASGTTEQKASEEDAGPHDDPDRRRLNLVEVPGLPLKGQLGSNRHKEMMDTIELNGGPSRAEPDSDDESDGEGEQELGNTTFMQEYNLKLTKELKETTMSTSFGANAPAPSSAESSSAATEAGPYPRETTPPGLEPHRSATVAEPDATELKDDDALDLDLNLVQNLLASYSAQGGLPGPISNLLGMMGMELPDDAVPPKSES